MLEVHLWVSLADEGDRWDMNLSLAMQTRANPQAGDLASGQDWWEWSPSLLGTHSNRRQASWMGTHPRPIQQPPQRIHRC